MREPDASSVMGSDPKQGQTVMRYVLDHVAKRGRRGDDMLAHATKGDVNIPVESIKGPFKSELDALLKKHGIDQNRYTVGAEGNSVHPDTGLPEFFGDAAGDSGAGDPGGAAGDPSGTDMGGGPGPGTSGSGGSAADKAAEASTSSVGTTTTDQPSTSGKSISEALGVPSDVMTGLNIGGKAATAASLAGLTAAGPAGLGLGVLTGVDTLSKHGVDQPSNPGGNLASSNIGGVGNVTGVSTDPGAGGPAVGGGAAAGDPLTDALLRALYGNVYAPGPR